MKKIVFLLFIALAFQGCSSESEVAQINQARKAMTQERYEEATKLLNNYLADGGGHYRLQALQMLIDTNIANRGSKDTTLQLLEEVSLEIQLAKVWPHMPQEISLWDTILETVGLADNNTSEIPPPPTQKQVLSQLALHYEYNKDWAKAMDTWKRLLRLPSNEQEAATYHMHSAKAFLQLEKKDLAVPHVNKCLDVQNLPVNVTAQCLQQLATIQNAQGKPKEALITLEKLVQLPDVEQQLLNFAIFELADYYAQEGKISKAIELFMSIENSYPNPIAVKTRIELLSKAN